MACASLFIHEMEIFINRFACCIVGFVYTKLYGFSTRNKNSTSTKNSIAEDDEADNILVVTTTPPSRETTMEENT